MVFTSYLYALVLYCFFCFCSQKTVTAFISAPFREHKSSRFDRLNMDAVEVGNEGYKSTNFENPPFFPSTVEELAYDVAFTTKIALVNRLQRIRVDVRLRLTNRDRYMLKWLILTSVNLLDDDEAESNVHIFIDKSCDVMRCQEIRAEIVRNNTAPIEGPHDWMSRTEVDAAEWEKIEKAKNDKLVYLNKLNRVHISPISDVHLRDSDSTLVIFNPDNMHSCEHPDLLEDVQALCFHAALRKIPVILINPQLMATAWNDFGARTPLLLADFAQAYFICDDYFMFSRRDQWCGIIQRAATGFDLFLLEGYPSVGGLFPKRYTRLQNWPNGMPYDIKSYLRQLLARDPNFPLKEIFGAEDLVNHGIRDVSYSADGKAYNNGDLKMKNYDDTGIEPLPLGDKKLKKVESANKSGWRNIVPAPPRRPSSPTSRQNAGVKSRKVNSSIGDTFQTN